MTLIILDFQIAYCIIYHTVSYSMKAVPIFLSLFCSNLVFVYCLPIDQQPPFPNENTDHYRLKQFDVTYEKLFGQRRNPTSDSSSERKTLVQKIKDITGKRQKNNNQIDTQPTSSSRERKEINVSSGNIS